MKQQKNTQKQHETHNNTQQQQTRGHTHFIFPQTVLALWGSCFSCIQEPFTIAK